MGRPSLPKDQVRTERVVAHLRRADLTVLERLARERGTQIGQVVREILERALAQRRK